MKNVMIIRFYEPYLGYSTGKWQLDTVRWNDTQGLDITSHQALFDSKPDPLAILATRLAVVAEMTR